MQPLTEEQSPLTPPISDQLLGVEARECQAVVANIFGYHSLQISPWDETPDLLATAQTISCHHLCVRPSGQLDGSFAGELLSLPVQEESLSLLVLHHVHELFGGSHGLLSELHRVLRPDGIAVVIGMSRWRRRRYPQFRPLSPQVLAERLRGFDMQTLMVRPLSQRNGALASVVTALTRRWAGVAWLGNLGQSYLLLARKSSRGSPVYPLRGLPVRQVKGAVSATSSSFTPSAPRDVK